MKKSSTIILLFLFCLTGLSFISPVNNKNKNENKPVPKEINGLLAKNNCSSCHTAYRRLVGPSFQSIGKMKYDAKRIAELVEKPQPNNWPGYPAMAPIKNVPFEDIKKLTIWMNNL